MSAARLTELAREGARHFDPEGYRFAERLVAAGLDDRAAPRIDKLASELRAARDAVERAAEMLTARGIDFEPGFASARAAGDHRTALRLAARLAQRGADTSTRARWAVSVAERARARGVRLPDELSYQVERLIRSREAMPAARATEIAEAVSRAMFVDSVSSSRAALAIARATDNVPSESGPYNCHAIAARVLAEMFALSPSYARAMVAGLDDLAALDALPVPPKPKSSGRRKQ